MVANLEAAIIDKFGVIVTWALVLALIMIAQAVYIMKTGFVALFFVRQPPIARLKRLRQRVGAAGVYFVSGAGILAVLIAAFIHCGGGFATLREWFKTHVEPLLIFILVAGSGIWFLVRPSTLVNWARQAHPQIPPDNRAALLIARLGGVMMLVFAFLILASLLHAG